LCHFKSFLRKHIRLFLDEQYAEYYVCYQQEYLPYKPPNLNHSKYEILLGGRPSNEKNGVKKILPITALSFSKERTLIQGDLQFLSPCNCITIPSIHLFGITGCSRRTKRDILAKYHEGLDFDWASHQVHFLPVA
jgi:hypothetical protein